MRLHRPPLSLPAYRGITLPHARLPRTLITAIRFSRRSACRATWKSGGRYRTQDPGRSPRWSRLYWAAHRAADLSRHRSTTPTPWGASQISCRIELASVGVLHCGGRVEADATVYLSSRARRDMPSYHGPECHRPRWTGLGDAGLQMELVIEPSMSTPFATA